MRGMLSGHLSAMFLKGDEKRISLQSQFVLLCCLFYAIAFEECSISTTTVVSSHS
jgi:hypothetical protein